MYNIFEKKQETVMSLLSSIILPALEEALANEEPVIAAFVVKQAAALAAEIATWAESKLPVAAKNG